MQGLFDLVFKESVAHIVWMLCIAILPGLWLGSRSVLGIKLGMTGVLFTSLAVGSLGIPLDPVLLRFLWEFGLILFVFAVGLQVGPGFFANLKENGVEFNLLAVGVVILGFALATVIQKVWGLPVEAITGIMTGATFNAPSLGAAQETLAHTSALGDDAMAVSGTGFAVAYPFGMFGCILSVILLRLLFKAKVADEAARFVASRKSKAEVCTCTIEVANPLLAGKNVADAIAACGSQVVFSRLRRGDQTHVPGNDDLLQLGDLVQVVCDRSALRQITSVVGLASTVDLRESGSGKLSVRKLLVSRNEAANRSLQNLQYDERFDVRITRIQRSGMAFVPDAVSTLHIGDQITVVGEEDGLKAMAQEVGDSRHQLEHPDLLPVFLGIALGVLVGSVTFHLPGLPASVRLGMAAGPMLVALVMGYKRSMGRINFYLPFGASQFMREFGILLFLAAVGLGSGGRFLQALSGATGWMWMGLGAAITLIPLLLMGIVARWRGHDYLTIAGLLAGSMTNPPTLGYASSLSSSQAPGLAFASVYPLTMFLRVMGAQVFVLLLA